MIADTLSMTIQLLESYQKECPEIYKEFEQELDDLDAKMFKMIEKLITAENIFKAAWGIDLAGETNMLRKRRKQKTTSIDTLIGQHTELTGDVRFTGGLYIDGTIKGNVIAENDDRAMLSLSEQGTIEGEVRVPFIVLNGVVQGDVHGSEHIELSSKARVIGNVFYNLIEMASGAEVNGKLVHSPAIDDEPLALSHADPLDAIA